MQHKILSNEAQRIIKLESVLSKSIQLNAKGEQIIAALEAQLAAKLAENSINIENSGKNA